jgi:hypothetical protein
MNARTVPLRTDEVRNRTRLGVAAGLAALACSVALALMGFPSAAGAVGAPVGLGTATSFAVLGGQTVTNTGPSAISGDLGVSPGTSVTNFPPGQVIAGTGTIHSADAVALDAQNDVVAAYNDAAGRLPVTAAPPDFGGMTLVSGVYGGPTLGLTGTLTLDGGGRSDGVWVFQAESTLITASSSVVSFTNGANPCNVYWKVGSSATLGTDSVMVGTVLALTTITAQTRALITGRLMARNGAVNLDTNVINRPTCTTLTPSSPASSATTSTGTGGGGGTGTGTGTATGTGTGTGTGAAPGGPTGSATARGVVPSTSNTATTPVGVAVPRVATPSTARTTSQIALTSQRIHLAQTGLPLVLMQLLGWAIVLAVVGAGLILGSGRFRAKYSGRH